MAAVKNDHAEKLAAEIEKTRRAPTPQTLDRRAVGRTRRSRVRDPQGRVGEVLAGKPVSQVAA